MLRAAGFVVATVFALATVATVGPDVAPARAGGTGAATGTLFDQSDAPLVGGTVWLLHDCGTSCDQTLTDDTGQYLFAGLLPGDDYCVAVNRPEDPEFCFQATDGTFTVPDIQVGPTAPGVLRGTVSTATGVPIDGASVTVGGSAATTDAAGTYRVTGLPPQDYTVTVSSAGYTPQTVSITLVGGTVNTLDLRLSAIDQLPSGQFAWSRNDGRLVVGGYATDDVGVARVGVAVRRISTGTWLHADGSWGGYQLLVATVARPGARRTDWRFRWLLPPERYGVALVVIDTASQRNPVPRPWRAVTVLP